MFQIKNCAENGCINPVFFQANACFQHLDNRIYWTEEVIKHIRANQTISNLNLAGLILENFDLAGKNFILCNLTKATFNHVNFKNTRMELLYFDFGTITNCDFRGSYITNTVFAGSTISGCDFSGSELNRNNFVGVMARNCKFNSSDLYASRFINSNITDVEFVDCNLKRVNFKRSALQGANFRYSNSEEAYFDGEI